MPMLVSQDGETLFSNTPSLPNENAEIEQTLQLKKTLRMIQLSSESIEELEALSINDNISLSWLVKTALENHLSQTTKYYAQGAEIT
jgi:hypothetical protein